MPVMKRLQVDGQLMMQQLMCVIVNFASRLEQRWRIVLVATGVVEVSVLSLH